MTRKQPDVPASGTRPPFTDPELNRAFLKLNPYEQEAIQRGMKSGARRLDKVEAAEFRTALDKMASHLEDEEEAN
jgi:hypothetical protein